MRATNLRASDLLRLRVYQVRDVAAGDAIEINEQKTGKPRRLTLNRACVAAIESLIAKKTYHPGEHLCYHGHIKSSLRDLMVFERLGLKPGDTLPARRIYKRVYERIDHLHEICGWGDGRNTAPFWSPCKADLSSPDKRYQALRKKGFLSTPGERRTGL